MLFSNDIGAIGRFCVAILVILAVLSPGTTSHVYTDVVI